MNIVTTSFENFTAKHFFLFRLCFFLNIAFLLQIISNMHSLEFIGILRTRNFLYFILFIVHVILCQTDNLISHKFFK